MKHGFISNQQIIAVNHKTRIPVFLTAVLAAILGVAPALFGLFSKPYN